MAQVWRLVCLGWMAEDDHVSIVPLLCGTLCFPGWKRQDNSIWSVRADYSCRDLAA